MTTTTTKPISKTKLKVLKIFEGLGIKERYVNQMPIMKKRYFTSTKHHISIGGHIHYKGIIIFIVKNIKTKKRLLYQWEAGKYIEFCLLELRQYNNYTEACDAVYAKLAERQLFITE